jgi:hypothetical protein
MKICLYHSDCFDGMGAAWAIKQRYPKTLFVPVNYHLPVPNFAAIDDVFIVDFSYETAQMLEIIQLVNSVTLLDHHPRTEQIAADISLWLETPQGRPYKDRVHVAYRSDASGAVMAWNHVFPHAPAPPILEHISDHDRWMFSMPQTKAVIAGLASYPLNLDTWDSLLRRPAIIEEMIFISPIALRIETMAVEWAIKNTLRKVEINGQMVPVINCAHGLASKAATQLAHEHAGIALAYYDLAGNEGRKFSVRSVGHVSAQAFALQFPGGQGHLNSAGFTVPRNHSLAQI